MRTLLSRLFKTQPRRSRQTRASLSVPTPLEQRLLLAVDLQSAGGSYNAFASTPAEGAWSYQAYPIAIGYTLCSLTFVLVGKYVSAHPNLTELEH